MQGKSILSDELLLAANETIADDDWIDRSSKLMAIAAARLEAYEVALRELDEAICEVRRQLPAETLGGIKEFSRAKLELALVHARKVLKTK